MVLNGAVEAIHTLLSDFLKIYIYNIKHKNPFNNLDFKIKQKCIISPLKETILHYTYYIVYLSYILKIVIQLKIGGLAVLAIGYTSKVDWSVYGNLLIAISATTEGGLLVLMAVTNNIWVNYAAYILYNIVLNVSFTIGWYLYFKKYEACTRLLSKL